MIEPDWTALTRINDSIAAEAHAGTITAERFRDLYVEAYQMVGPDGRWALESLYSLLQSLHLPGKWLADAHTYTLALWARSD